MHALLRYCLVSENTYPVHRHDSDAQHERQFVAFSATDRNPKRIVSAGASTGSASIPMPLLEVNVAASLTRRGKDAEAVVIAPSL
jgi:hypothetical protein